MASGCEATAPGTCNRLPNLARVAIAINHMYDQLGGGYDTITGGDNLLHLTREFVSVNTLHPCFYCHPLLGLNTPPARSLASTNRLEMRQVC